MIIYHTNGERKKNSEENGKEQGKNEWLKAQKKIVKVR